MYFFGFLPFWAWLLFSQRILEKAIDQFSGDDILPSDSPLTDPCSTYTIGVALCTFFYFPLVAFGSFIILPLNDFCKGIPQTGDDASIFLKTFSTNGNISGINQTLIAIFQNCLTNPQGYVWNIGGVDRQGIINRLQKYNASNRVGPTFFSHLNTAYRDLTRKLAPLPVLLSYVCPWQPDSPTTTTA